MLERMKCWQPAFPPFPSMPFIFKETNFTVCAKANVIIRTPFNLLSTDVFNLNQSRVLSFGKQWRRVFNKFLWSVNLFPNKSWFLLSAVQVFWQNWEKKRNCLWWAISPFPTVFSTHSENFLSFSSNLKLSSANSFSLESSKICHWERVNNWILQNIIPSRQHSTLGCFRRQYQGIVLGVGLSSMFASCKN